jgi:hypothetical protein
MSSEYESVVVFGRAAVVNDDKEALHALRLLLDKYLPHLVYGKDYSPIETEELAKVAVYRISIEEWSGKQKHVEANFPNAFWLGEMPTRKEN